MKEILISKEFRSKWAGMKLACLECSVEVVPFHPKLWQTIGDETLKMRSTLKVEQISQHPAISSSRKGYKAFGKDPARYRLSAEALMRRMVKGNELYQINNVVDIVNLASFTSGFSIGGYDIEKVGGTIELGIGREDEAYEGLGRGILNIDCLPVLRDTIGPFGSPTSDSPRTAVTESTFRFLMVYFGFGAHDLLPEALQKAQQLLTDLAKADRFETWFVE